MFKFIAKFAAVAALTVAAGVAAAYPTKPITLIVPFSAGTINDILARDFAQALTSVAKVNVVVENRTGAEGTLGGMGLLSAPADGHTLMFSSNSLTVFDPLIKKTIPYDPIKDLVPVCSVGRSTLLLNVSAAGPYKTVTDFVAAAKAQPGKLTFAYASTGMRLAGEMFAQAAGVQLTGVPYRASVAGLTDVSSGQVDAVFIDHSSARSFFEGGKLRPLVAGAQKRIAALPNLPSAAEAGLPAFAVQPWFGVYASGKTPPAIMAQVNELVGRAVKTPEIAAMQQNRGLESADTCGDAMVKFRNDEMETWRAVVKKAGIQPS
ncbi:Bug family tripartite tricarboxylate transporter substrate binding protein [Ramlibacter sp.]|uniref:Bug family tripartite tricarboxylate transporter substrate binding protein n=1 Tax=Ramlibacter sp. TaxID=1917967 RepID=UPI003D0A3C23